LNSHEDESHLSMPYSPNSPSTSFSSSFSYSRFLLRRSWSSPGIVVGSAEHHGWALPLSAYDPWRFRRRSRTTGVAATTSAPPPRVAAPAAASTDAFSQYIGRKTMQSPINNDQSLVTGGSSARQATGAIGRATVAAAAAVQPFGLNSSPGASSNI